MILIENIMTTNLVTVELDDSLKKVKEIFETQRFHHLIVVDHGKIFGVISDRDLLKAISPNLGTYAETVKDSATLNKKVHQIVTRKPVTLISKAGFFDAVRIFNLHSISCIPIVDNENRPIGIVTWRDLMKLLEKALTHRHNNSN